MQNIWSKLMAIYRLVDLQIEHVPKKNADVTLTGIFASDVVRSVFRAVISQERNQQQSLHYICYRIRNLAT